MLYRSFREIKIDRINMIYKIKYKKQSIENFF